MRTSTSKPYAAQVSELPDVTGGEVYTCKTCGGRQIRAFMVENECVWCTHRRASFVEAITNGQGTGSYRDNEGALVIYSTGRVNHAISTYDRGENIGTDAHRIAFLPRLWRTEAALAHRQLP